MVELKRWDAKVTLVDGDVEEFTVDAYDEEAAKVAASDDVMEDRAIGDIESIEVFEVVNPA